MNKKAKSSTGGGSETVDNLPSSYRAQQSEAAREVVGYLRSLGLTVAYEDTFQHWMLNEPRKLANLSDDSAGITPWDDLPDCSIPPIVSAPEKWEIHDKSLFFLRDVCRRQSEAEVEEYIRKVKERTEADSIRQLKVELPLLRTDNEIDLLRYKRKIHTAREVHLSDHHLPLEPCDDNKDEGLEFPPQAYAADRKIVKGAENEKIEISKHSFETLLRNLKTDWTEADQIAMLRSQVQYKGVFSIPMSKTLLDTN